MFKEVIQEVDGSLEQAHIDPTPSRQNGVIMTEGMPGPVPRQRSKRTELGTITEKQSAKSPTSDSPDIFSGMNATLHTSQSDNDEGAAEGRAGISSASTSSATGASSVRLRTKRPSAELDDGQTWASSESDEEELGAKTPRMKPTSGRMFSSKSSNDGDSEEEFGTKTPRSALNLSRPQISKQKSSHREKGAEPAFDSEEDAFHVSDEDAFDVEKNLDASSDTDLNAAERDVESRDDDLHIRLQQVRGRRHLTILEGLSDEYNHRRLLKELKKTFACNGNVKKVDGQKVVILQGNHCQDLRQFLINEQVPPATIRMHNF